MTILKEAFAGIAAAITTSLLVMGAIVLAVTEGMILPTAEPVEEVTTLDPMQAMLFPFTTPTPPRAKIQLVAAPTQPFATTCPTPAGWEAYNVLKGDTLRALAEARQTSVELVVKNNCMTGTSLVPDTRLFLPPAPPPTPTPLTPTATFTPSATSSICPHPAGWVRYLVRPGDNLFRIGLAYGVSPAILQKANCLASINLIFPGTSIYVPNVAPHYTATTKPFYPTATRVKPSPTRTFTVRPTSTNTLVPTMPPSTATFTPTSTSVVPTATFTPTPTATNSATPISPTATDTPTPTPTPTSTATNTVTTTPTGTNLPTNTSTPTVTMTSTNTLTGN